MSNRGRLWPAALSATATHDTKRGEDVRARLNVLSEIPGEWKAAVTKWRSLNRRLKMEAGGRTAPDSNEEYLLYQTLVGAWPFAVDEEQGFVPRLEQYVTKALREAKMNTSWLTPDDEYERAVLTFVSRMLDVGRPFLQAFRPFQRRVAEIGMVNSLAQLVIKCTAPGVPDFYQGTELWDLSLVDPDNRRPVDYAQRVALLDEIGQHDPSPAVARSLFDARVDGRVKLFTMVRALAARHASPHTFSQGDYVPLRTSGAGADHVFAFARMHDRGVSVTCVPRLVASLPGGGSDPTAGASCWTDTSIIVPSSIHGHELVDAFTGQPAGPRVRDDGDAHLDVADLFGHFPVALLTSAAV
jgi:(1->4)-alpha-D-glucan 1-alpha-D-glucosylmutase